jgi:hypothetical protein
MSTGGGPSGPRRDQDADDEQTFADVLNAFSFGDARRRRKASGTRDTPQDMAHHEQEEASPAPADESFGQAPAVDDQPATWEPGNAERGAPAASVRAYVWTGGRTRSRHHFEIETLVTAAEPSSSAVTQPHRTVLGLCREPRSVAEVAALLAMPLGVAMVILGDMADRGMIVVHGAATGDGGAPSPTLMERVLIGLRQL